MITLSPPSTALILVDLQRAVLALQTEPRTSSSVLANCKLLAERFRSAGAPVILSNVAFASDFGDLLRTPVDQASPAAKGPLMANWFDIDEIGSASCREREGQVRVEPGG